MGSGQCTSRVVQLGVRSCLFSQEQGNNQGPCTREHKSPKDSPINTLAWNKSVSVSLETNLGWKRAWGSARGKVGKGRGVIQLLCLGAL